MFAARMFAPILKVITSTLIIAALVWYILPTLTVFFVFSIIGAPIGLLIGQGAGFIVFAAVVAAVCWILPTRDLSQFAFNVAIALAVIFVLPAAVNSVGYAKSAILTYGDGGELPSDFPPEAVVINKINVSGGGYKECYPASCIDILMAGKVKRLMLTSNHSDTALGGNVNPKFPISSFRFERRADCPVLPVPKRKDAHLVAGNKSLAAFNASISDAEQRARNGDCLINERVGLDQANAIIRYEELLKPRLDGYRSSIVRDMTGARRVTVKIRDGKGFRVVYRKTGVWTLWSRHSSHHHPVRRAKKFNGLVYFRSVADWLG